MRDDFNQQTKEKLAQRAGYCCSKTDCQMPTRGAASDDDGTINIGVAAHITAASPRGPRYDARLTSDQRKHHSNGIWLCETHAKLIDSDENNFTISLLYSWKSETEKNSFNALVLSNSIPEQIAHPSTPDDQNIVSRLGLPMSDNIQSVTSRIIDFAKQDIAACKRIASWPQHNIHLDLKISDDNKSHAFNLSGLANVIKSFSEISVVAPPGSGKTTTLLQLTELLLDEEKLVVSFIPLNQWSTSSDNFFQNLTRRLAFQGTNEQHFKLLAHYGRLILILDGWNELNEKGKLRATEEIEFLQRDFPKIRFIIGTRQKELDIPISGPVVKISQLSEKQQLEIARALRADEGEALLDHAWRTHGIRELVSIPLYLTALLVKTSDDKLPTTKEEVLRMFVDEHEKVPKKAAILRNELLGFHKNILTEIAVESTHNRSTGVSGSQARSNIKNVENELKKAKQITAFPEPTKTLDILINTHMLVRGNGEDGGISFHHHQFQEWYASFKVEELMLCAHAGNSESLTRLRRDILNVPIWEESILFACDRLSRIASNDSQAVASAILETMVIDSLLAAEMIYRSSEKVWKQVKEPIEKFIERWHKKGTVDRAVKFMINTGRSEFKVYLWPLISNEDDQIHLPALRAGHRFRPSVLGSDVSERITSLSEPLRKHIISEIAHESSIEGIELATQLAKNDKSSQVKFSVVEALLFRRADRFVADILESAPDDVWVKLAKKGYAREITLSKISERLKKEEEKLFQTKTSPRTKLHTLLYQSKCETEAGKKISTFIQEIDFSENDRHDDSNIHKAHELYPNETVKALITHLENGKPVPYGTNDFLKTSGILVDDGPIVELITNPNDKEKIAAIAAHIIGPKTIIKLITQLLDVNSRLKKSARTYNKEVSEEYHRLIGYISCTSIRAFSIALLSYVDTKTPHEITLFSDLIARHGDIGNRSTLILSDEDHKNITNMVQKWTEILLTSPVATRSQFGEIARVIERLGSPQLIPVLKRLLSEDLIRQERARKEYLGAIEQGQRIDNDAHTCWALQYQNSFASIGDRRAIEVMKAYLSDAEFGFEAASALKSIWKKKQPTIQENDEIFQSWPDFSGVSEQRLRRIDNKDGETFEFVDDILAIVNNLKTETDHNEHIRALKLAGVAFSMPYSGKEGIIKELGELPVHGEAKNTFLTVLVLAGEVVEADIVMAGFQDLLKDPETKKWMLGEQNGWRVENWLRLFPFTNSPGALFDALDLLEPRYKEPWNLRGAVSALRHAPSNEAEEVLFQLAKRDSRFLGMYEWLNALTQRNTFSAACMLLDLICGGSLLAEKGSHDRWDISQKLSFLISSQERFRAEVYKRFPQISEAQGKAIIENSISDSADTDGILLLVKGYACQKRSIKETGLYTALRSALVGTRPSIEWSGMEEQYSLPAASLRKKLFRVVINNDDIHEAQLASECLNIIDEMHDDYGQVEFEVRHPDITSGKPWPLVDICTQTNQEETVGIVKPTIELPYSSKPIDITKHHFDVSVSFPGEVREYVESVVTYLEGIIGPNSCFYDSNYKAQLARPSLDELLQGIYQERSNLVVVFLCEKYQEKNWCGVEFKAIREILFERKNEKVMYIKMDDGEVNGVFKTDGYIDGRTHTPKEIAGFIHERLLGATD